MDTSQEKKTDLGEETAAESPFRWPDLDDPKIGRRGTGSIMDLFGKYKDDPLFDEVWDQILRDREAQTELAEREAME